MLKLCFSQLSFAFLGTTVSSSLSLMTILFLHCSTPQQLLTAGTGNAAQTNPAVYCETRCIAATVWVAFGFSEHLKKTTVWNYLSAPSYSVFIVLATCSAAARRPGRFRRLCWLLVLPSLLATGLSAPSDSIFIVLEKGCRCCQPGRSTISSSLSFCLPLCCSSSVDSLQTLSSQKCDVIRKLCIRKSVMINFVQTSNVMSAYMNVATVYYTDKTFISDVSKGTAFL